jgi:hypothetical protein
LREFEFPRQLSTAESSFDLVELWTAHSKKQSANEQIKELMALRQEMAGESAEPITRTFSQVFKNAS